jgi:zinc transport system permease protein
MTITDFLHYEFIQRALLGGIFIAMSCAALGVFLVLRRYSLIGDGLAHATFSSVALALLLGMSPLYVSIPIVMACALGILKLTEKIRLYGDAAIGVISALGLAVGIMISSLAGGFNVDLFSYLFGSILSISNEEVILSIILSIIVMITVASFFNDLVSLTFDEESAKASGICAVRINTIFVLLTALTVVLTMKVVGILLVSALLILPAVTAIQLAGSFRTTMTTAALAAVLSVSSGIAVSFYFNLPTGATIVLINMVFFATALLYRKMT